MELYPWHLMMSIHPAHSHNGSHTTVRMPEASNLMFRSFFIIFFFFFTFFFSFKNAIVHSYIHICHTLIMFVVYALVV